MDVASTAKIMESPASILLRVPQVAATVGSEAGFAEVRDLPETQIGTLQPDDAERNAEASDWLPEDDSGQNSMAGQDASCIRSVSQGAASSVLGRMTARRFVGVAALVLLVASGAMIAVGVKHQRDGHTKSVVEGGEELGFSETVVPGANYSPLPPPRIPEPSGELATLSFPNDNAGSGVIQSAVFQAPSQSGPRGAWLVGTIEEESDFTESVSHDRVGPRLR